MKYYIIAGEASGDLHGGNLLRALLERDPDAEVRFWGGDRMAEAAASAPKGKVVQVRHIRDLAFMGIVEVVSHLGSVLGNIGFCKKDILAFLPDTVVFIDYPGFNLRIAKFTHAHGLRNVYYISPQIWAWKKRRIGPMRRDLDKLCYILPTEKDFYAANSFPQAVFVGHPLLDEVARYRSLSSEKGIDASVSHDNKPLIALLPGSRRHELERMLPTMMELARLHGEYRFVVAGMSLIGEEFYRSYMPDSLSNVSIEFNNTYKLLSECRAAVVCSGTATLETALFKVPQVVCYKSNPISYAIAKRLIGNRIQFISLVNLIARHKVVTELIQDEYNISRLDEELVRIVIDGNVRETMMMEYSMIDGMLGGEGASRRVAEIVCECR